ncbi:hypothetical protein EON81_19715, partial [bacterium]
MAPFEGKMLVSGGRARPTGGIAFPATYSTNCRADSATSVSFFAGYPGGSGNYLLLPQFVFDGTESSTPVNREYAVETPFSVKVGIRMGTGAMTDLKGVRIVGGLGEAGWAAIEIPGDMGAGTMEVRVFYDAALGQRVPACLTCN